ncbi:MAG: S41 family peptidase [Ignavibacteria bacterium]|jgi:C-terminal processing protease CtpA/Prc
MKLIRHLFLCIVLLSATCFASDKALYKKVISQALEITMEHSINSNSLNKAEIKKEIMQRAEEVNSDDKLYEVLQILIDSLKDNHSFLITADGNRWQRVDRTQEKTEEGSIPKEKLRDKRIAYVNVAPMSSASKIDKNAYADKLYNKIIDAYSHDMTGWILDFRGNSGGQLWPMLAGLSSLINSDTAGFAIYPNNNNWNWWAKNGKAGVGTNVHHQIEHVSNKPLQKKPIAILISRQTASSGEASVISFIGKENICLFGEQTKGLATVNQPFELANGAKLMLTTAYFGDRNKKIYAHGIEPEINISNKGENDIQLDTAIEWLTEQK